MSYNPSDYSNVVNKLTEYYGVSSQEIWNIVNNYNIDPSQLDELLPKYGVQQSADGLYRIYNNAGDTISYVNQTTVPMGTGNAMQEAINSNTQTGTASTATKERWAGNSVIDQNGKIRTSPGVTKYTNGSPSGTIMGIVGNVASSIGAAATGISLGKAIDSRLYNANPTFWNSLGLDTLNPQTWSRITTDLGDTGLEGALKTAFNFIFGIDNNGNTQAYMDADAYKYVAYALAKKGMFDTAERSASSDDTSIPNYEYVPHSFNIITINADTTFLTFRAIDSTYDYYQWHRIVPGNDPVQVAIVAAPLLNSNGYYLNILFSSKSAFQVGGFSSTYSHSETPSTPTINSLSTISTPFYIKDRPLYLGGLQTSYTSLNINSVVPFTNIESYNAYLQYQRHNGDRSSAYIMVYGTIRETTALDGVTDQTGATTPNGLSSTSTQQEVEDAIAQQYPDLENSRVEQTVVQPDGTTIIKKYYPVPMPNDVTDTIIPEPETVTTDSPITIILQEGETIILTDGTVINGDGVTPITIPPGTYTLPINTTITNNYVTNTTNTTGGTQTSTETNNTSSNTLLQTIINILTNPEPQTISDTPTEDTTSTETTTDTGEGNTPPTVIPVGSASALWSVYNPTLAELNSLGAWLWSSSFVDQLLKMFSDPMQAIIGLHKTYIRPYTGAAQNIVVGYLDSGVSCLTVPTQYSSMDCGTVNLAEYFGNVFDYSPYTRVFLYLPFIGFKELDVSQVMRSSINVKYYGDAYTGAGLAEVKVTRDAGAGGVLYTFGCDVAAKYPLSSGSYMGIISGITSIAAGATMALGGMINPIMGLGGMVGSAMGARTKVEQSGGFSGNSGAMGIKKPYLVVMRPQTAMASNYKHFSGAPSNDNVTIGNASGFIRVRECHVEHISEATDQEKTMIERMLKDGVVV